MQQVECRQIRHSYDGVRDAVTELNLTIRRGSLPHGNYQPLKQDAVGIDGEPLPPEFLDDAPTPSTTSKKESDK